MVEDEWSDDMAWYSELEKQVLRESENSKLEANQDDEDEEKKRLYQKQDSSQKAYRNNDSY